MALANFLLMGSGAVKSGTKPQFNDTANLNVKPANATGLFVAVGHWNSAYTEAYWSAAGAMKYGGVNVPFLGASHVNAMNQGDPQTTGYFMLDDLSGVASDTFLMDLYQWAGGWKWCGVWLLNGITPKPTFMIEHYLQSYTGATYPAGKVTQAMNNADNPSHLLLVDHLWRRGSTSNPFSYMDAPAGVESVGGEQRTSWYDFQTYNAMTNMWAIENVAAAADYTYWQNQNASSVDIFAFQGGGGGGKRKAQSILIGA